MGSFVLVWPSLAWTLSCRLACALVTCLEFRFIYFPLAGLLLSSSVVYEFVLYALSDRIALHSSIAGSTHTAAVLLTVDATVSHSTLNLNYFKPYISNSYWDCAFDCFVFNSSMDFLFKRDADDDELHRCFAFGLQNGGVPWSEDTNQREYDKFVLVSLYSVPVSLLLRAQWLFDGHVLNLCCCSMPCRLLTIYNSSNGFIGDFYYLDVWHMMTEYLLTAVLFASDTWTRIVLILSAEHQLSQLDNHVWIVSNNLLVLRRL